MALDLDLPGSYAKLSSLSFDSGGEERDRLEEARLMRESRVWFETFIMENMYEPSQEQGKVAELTKKRLSIDCGKKPGIRATSEAGMRRCRVLLGNPSRTALDFRLLSQVEVGTRNVRTSRSTVADMIWQS